MSTAQIWETDSTSLDNTLAIAEQVGQRLRGGEVIDLVSDLGGGKTAFVKGMAKGMGVRETVGSPSFTLGNEYSAGDLTLQHFDFYRLGEPGLMTHNLEEVMNDPKNVVVVEWANIVNTVLPEKRLTIRIRATGQDSRHLSFHYPTEVEYLIPVNS